MGSDRQAILQHRFHYIERRTAMTVYITHKTKDRPYYLLHWVCDGVAYHDTFRTMKLLREYIANWDVTETIHVNARG